MGSGKSLLIKLSQAVSLDDDIELLNSLAALARKWRDLAGDVDGYSSAVALIRAVANGTSDPSVKAAFDKLGAKDELAKLTKAAARTKALLDSVPDVVAKLLAPISTYNEQGGAAQDSGVVRWPLLDKKVGGGNDKGDGGASYALSLKANAALIIEAGDTWPYSDPMPGPLLRMRAEGGLEPSASATLPFSAGSLSASANAKAHCALEYYFAPSDQQSIYAFAVAERIGDLPDPFDFDSVWDAFAKTDLAGIHYEFDGEANVDVAVTVADSFAFRDLLKLDLGAKISVGIDLGDKFFLTFRAGAKGADGEPRIIAALSRQRSKGGDLGASLGITVDLAGLAARVHGILAEALGQWDAVLADIKPYLSPGTWLQNKAGGIIEKEAKDLLKDEALRAAIVRDLQGSIGLGDSEDSALVEWLTGKLGGAIDSASGWARDHSAAALDATNVLGGKLPAFAQDDIKPKIKNAADKLIGHVQSELEKEVNDLFANRSADLGKALHKIGVAVQDKVKTLDDALESVRSLIDRYDRIFHKVLDATQDAARTKISAAVQIQESRLKSATLELSGTMLARSDRTRELFHALTRGELKSLVKLFEAGGAADFALDRDNSSLKRYASSKSKFGLELVLFGFGITGSELLTSEASVMVDGTGTVQVDTQAMIQKRSSGLDADREIDLVSSFSLVAARALQVNGAPPEAQRGLGLSVSMGHVDKGLERQEVDRFVGSLVSAGLIAPGALSTAQSKFTVWAGTPGSNGKIAGALLLKLALDQASLSSLLCLGAMPNPGALPDAWRRWIVRVAFEAIRAASTRDRQSIESTLALLAEELPGRTLDDLLDDPGKTRKALEVEIPGSHIPRVPEEDEPFAAALTLSHGLYDMIETLRQIYFSTPETVEDDKAYTWSPADYAGAERRAAKAVSGWLQLNTELFWTNSKVHPRMIAFINSLLTIGRIDRTNAVSLVMWRTDRDPETVVLSPANA